MQINLENAQFYPNSVQLAHAQQMQSALISQQQQIQFANMSQLSQCSDPTATATAGQFQPTHRRQRPVSILYKPPAITTDPEQF